MAPVKLARDPRSGSRIGDRSPIGYRPPMVRSGAGACAATPFARRWLEPADGRDNLFGHQLQRTKGTGPDNCAVRDLHA